MKKLKIRYSGSIDIIDATKKQQTENYLSNADCKEICWTSTLEPVDTNCQNINLFINDKKQKPKTVRQYKISFTYTCPTDDESNFTDPQIIKLQRLDNQITTSDKEFIGEKLKPVMNHIVRRLVQEYKNSKLKVLNAVNDPESSKTLTNSTTWSQSLSENNISDLSVKKFSTYLINSYNSKEESKLNCYTPHNRKYKVNKLKNIKSNKCKSSTSKALNSANNNKYVAYKDVNDMFLLKRLKTITLFEANFDELIRTTKLCIVQLRNHHLADINILLSKLPILFHSEGKYEECTDLNHVHYRKIHLYTTDYESTEEIGLNYSNYDGLLVRTGSIDDYSLFKNSNNVDRDNNKTQIPENLNIVNWEQMNDTKIGLFKESSEALVENNKRLVANEKMTTEDMRTNDDFLCSLCHGNPLICLTAGKCDSFIEKYAILIETVTGKRIKRNKDMGIDLEEFRKNINDLIENIDNVQVVSQNSTDGLATSQVNKLSVSTQIRNIFDEKNEIKKTSSIQDIYNNVDLTPKIHKEMKQGSNTNQKLQNEPKLMHLSYVHDITDYSKNYEKNEIIKTSSIQNIYNNIDLAPKIHKEIKQDSNTNQKLQNKPEIMNMSNVHDITNYSKNGKKNEVIKTSNSHDIYINVDFTPKMFEEMKQDNNTKHKLQNKSEIMNVSNVYDITNYSETVNTDYTKNKKLVEESTLDTGIIKVSETQQDNIIGEVKEFNGIEAISNNFDAKQNSVSDRKKGIQINIPEDGENINITDRNSFKKLNIGNLMFQQEADTYLRTSLEGPHEIQILLGVTNEDVTERELNDALLHKTSAKVNKSKTITGDLDNVTELSYSKSPTVESINKEKASFSQNLTTLTNVTSLNKIVENETLKDIKQYSESETSGTVVKQEYLNMESVEKNKTEETKSSSLIKVYEEANAQNNKERINEYDLSDSEKENSLIVITPEIQSNRANANKHNDTTPTDETELNNSVVANVTVPDVLKQSSSEYFSTSENVYEATEEVVGRHDLTNALIGENESERLSLTSQPIENEPVSRFSLKVRESERVQTSQILQQPTNMLDNIDAEIMTDEIEGQKLSNTVSSKESEVLEFDRYEPDIVVEVSDYAQQQRGFVKEVELTEEKTSEEPSKVVVQRSLSVTKRTSISLPKKPSSVSILSGSSELPATSSSSSDYYDEGTNMDSEKTITGVSDYHTKSLDHELVIGYVENEEKDKLRGDFKKMTSPDYQLYGIYEATSSATIDEENMGYEPKYWRESLSSSKIKPPTKDKTSILKNLNKISMKSDTFADISMINKKDQSITNSPEIIVEHKPKFIESTDNKYSQTTREDDVLKMDKELRNSGDFLDINNKKSVPSISESLSKLVQNQISADINGRKDKKSGPSISESLSKLVQNQMLDNTVIQNDKHSNPSISESLSKLVQRRLSADVNVRKDNQSIPRISEPLNLVQKDFPANTDVRKDKNSGSNISELLSDLVKKRLSADLPRPRNSQPLSNPTPKQIADDVNVQKNKQSEHSISELLSNLVQKRLSPDMNGQNDMSNGLGKQKSMPTKTIDNLDDKINLMNEMFDRLKSILLMGENYLENLFRTVNGVSDSKELMDLFKNICTDIKVNGVVNEDNIRKVCNFVTDDCKLMNGKVNVQSVKFDKEVDNHDYDCNDNDGSVKDNYDDMNNMFENSICTLGNKSDYPYKEMEENQKKDSQFVDDLVKCIAKKLKNCLGFDVKTSETENESTPVMHKFNDKIKPIEQNSRSSQRNVSKNRKPRVQSYDDIGLKNEKKNRIPKQEYKQIQSDDEVCSNDDVVPNSNRVSNTPPNLKTHTGDPYHQAKQSVSMDSLKMCNEIQSQMKGLLNQMKQTQQQVNSFRDKFENCYSEYSDQKKAMVVSNKDMHRSLSAQELNVKCKQPSESLTRHTVASIQNISPSVQLMRQIKGGNRHIPKELTSNARRALLNSKTRKYFIGLPNRVNNNNMIMYPKAKSSAVSVSSKENKLRHMR